MDANTQTTDTPDRRTGGGRTTDALAADVTALNWGLRAEVINSKGDPRKPFSYEIVSQVTVRLISYEHVVLALLPVSTINADGEVTTLVSRIIRAGWARRCEVVLGDGFLIASCELDWIVGPEGEFMWMTGTMSPFIEQPPPQGWWEKLRRKK